MVNFEAVTEIAAHTNGTVNFMSLLTEQISAHVELVETNLTSSLSDTFCYTMTNNVSVLQSLFCEVLKLDWKQI
jgi:hypothetical protein